MAFENRYTGLDQALHRIAFSTQSAQLALADLEDALYRKQLDEITIVSPVFITALPRAGTTLLLDMLYHHPAFATHTYRNMPFVMLPLFWQKMSGMFGVSDAQRQRAHGDGLEVSVDSPEAFEELVWKYFWPEHYLADRIRPWVDESNEDFLEFYRSHIRKIVLLRRRVNGTASRYISKNNLNIARIGYLKKVFPDAAVVVPFRSPAEHAASLLKQHMNFLAIHDDDEFAMKYMRDIGHFDFGRSLKPIDFDGWVGNTAHSDPTTLDFWLQYWVKAYEDVLGGAKDSCHALCFEALCEDGERGFARVIEKLGIDLDDDMREQARRIRMPRSHAIDTAGVDGGLLCQADTVYEALRAISII